MSSCIFHLQYTACHYCIFQKKGQCIATPQHAQQNARFGMAGGPPTKTLQFVAAVFSDRQAEPEPQFIHLHKQAAERPIAYAAPLLDGRCVGCGIAVSSGNLCNRPECQRLKNVIH